MDELKANVKESALKLLLLCNGRELEKGQTEMDRLHGVCMCMCVCLCMCNVICFFVFFLFCFVSVCVHVCVCVFDAYVVYGINKNFCVIVIIHIYQFFSLLFC